MERQDGIDRSVASIAKSGAGESRIARSGFEQGWQRSGASSGRRNPNQRLRGSRASLFL